jgi:DNA-binding CsgD family transcriptional regulator
VIKTSLTFAPGNYPVPLAYLHTMAACNHMALHQPREAEREFEEAWRYAAPDGIVAPFIEHYVHLQGLLDSCMKRSDPGLYRAISKAAGRFRAGWVAIVDPASAEIFETSPLTPSEMTIAALASRGWTNREIATQLTLSENTVKHRLSSVFQKLGVSRRSELSDFPLT